MISRLHCVRGEADAVLEIRPHDDFGRAAGVTSVPGGVRLDVGGRVLGLWSSHPLQVEVGGAVAQVQLAEGEEVWAVLGCGEVAVDPAGWSAERAQAVTDKAVRY